MTFTGTRTPKLATALAGLIAAAALAISGCAATPGTDDDTANMSPDADISDTPNGDGDSADNVVEITPAQCVIGTWQVDNTKWEAYMNSLAVSTPATVRVSGASFIRFAEDGTFSMWREDFAFEMSAQGQTVTHVSNSGETGDYGLVLDWGTPPSTDFLWVAETMVVMHDEVLVVGGIATHSDQGGGSTTIDLFNGYTAEVPRIAEREAVEGSLPFRCHDDTLTFEFDAGLTMDFHRTA